MSTSVTINLVGRPISKKNNRTLIRRGRATISIPSAAYQRYQEDCMWQLKKYRKSFGDETISADFIFSMKGKLDTDIDNMVSGVLDILQDAEVFPDDKKVVEIHAIKVPGCKDWGAQINLKAK